MAAHNSDPDFRLFIDNLARAIDQYEGDNTTEAQKDQVERLVELEIKFRKALIRHHWGKHVFNDFLDLILKQKRNILMARPFYRERNEVFQAYISDTIRTRNYRVLYRFHFNYNFIEFCMNSRKWFTAKSGGVLVKTYNEIKALRKELVERNMPLAISEARLFYGKTPKSHLTYMDMVQIAADGLVSAVDKFCLPYSPVFRAVIIGRIRGNLIEAYSDTYLHFYPGDKRRIYRAHKALGKYRDGPVDYEAVAEEVNKDGFKDQVNVGELVNLLAAASVVSANALPPHDDEAECDSPVNPIDRYPTHVTEQADSMYEEAQATNAVKGAIVGLSVFDQKLLKLKGVCL